MTFTRAGGASLGTASGTGQAVSYTVAVVGNLLIASAQINSLTVTATIADNASGSTAWTLLDGPTDSTAGSARQYTWWKIAQASTTVTSTLSGSISNSLHINEFSLDTGPLALVAHATFGGSASSGTTTPDQTTDRNCLFYGFACADATATVTPGASGGGNSTTYTAGAAATNRALSSYIITESGGTTGAGMPAGSGYHFAYTLNSSFGTVGQFAAFGAVAAATKGPTVRGRPYRFFRRSG